MNRNVETGGAKRPKKKLRKGYTTGTCAAAAAGAALELKLHKVPRKTIEVILPDGKTVTLPVHRTGNSGNTTFAEIKKDAGDDPDVTHGAIIGCEIRFTDKYGEVELKKGDGIGIVTRPGLSVAVGEPAINPVPRQMIINEISRRLPAHLLWKYNLDVQKSHNSYFHRWGWLRKVCSSHAGLSSGIEATLYIQNGEKLARKTLNPRLGIIGGLSILGTTGIVKPFSSEAYKETIDICIRGAKTLGLEQIILTTGGKSEKFMRNLFPNKNDMAFVQFADFLHYATTQAVKMGFQSLLYGCFFGKLCKWAMGYKYTHAHKTLQDINKLSEIARKNGLTEEFATFVAGANTAREVFDSAFNEKKAFTEIIGRMALRTIENFAGPDIALRIHLFNFNGTLRGTWDSADKKSHEEN